MVQYKNRWYQDEAEFSIFDYFAKGGQGNPIVAMPTGTGKSVVIANFITKVFKLWPNQRIMMLTHVKKLIQQNAEKQLSVWSTAPIGIHSAGLKARDTIQPIIFGGVQSVTPTIKKALKANDNRPEYLKHFGWRDLIIIDECHLVSPKEATQYQYTINELKKINPNLKVIGFTATDYRLKQGQLTDEGLFTDVCYDLTTMESFNRLIAEGFLAPLIPKRTSTVIDISNVGMSQGDYNLKQLSETVDKDEITYSAVKEMVELGYNRKKWLIFAASIEHAEHISAMLQSFGIGAAAVHSKLKPEVNDQRIADFKNGMITALVNNDMLTTGFDEPGIDLIGILRHTLSPGLWVQMLGRGTRPSPDTGKQDCLVLDFAKNTPRLGPINDPIKPRKPKKRATTGDAPVKICEVCGAYNHTSARQCIDCGAEFSFKSKLFKTAGSDELIKSDAPIVELYDVQKCLYTLHEKKNSPPSMKLSYYCGLQMFNEWVCLEHEGFAGKRARDWWRQRHGEEAPPTTYLALQKVSQLRTPSQIRVWVNKKHPEILGHEF